MKILTKNKEVIKTVAQNAAKSAKGAINKIKSKTIKTPKTATNFNLLSILWSFISIILFKIPLVSKISRKIISWYAKTSWWKLTFRILTRVRKAFIIFNALIAIYALIDITGFSTDNIIAGVYGLGATYIEMITSLFKSIFNWIVKFLDLNVVPNPPLNSPWERLEHKEGSWKWWGPKENTVVSVDANNYTQSAFPRYSYEAEPLSKWENYIFYGILTVIGIGVLYLGYKIVIDPSTSEYFRPKDPKGKGAETVFDADSTRNITLFGIFSGALKAAGQDIHKVVSEYLNPFSEYNSTEHRLRLKNAFESEQLKSENPDRSYYPYTVYNKYDSWFDYFKKMCFQENEIASAHRKADLKSLLIRGTMVDLEMVPTPAESSKKSATFPLNFVTDMLPSPKTIANVQETTEVASSSRSPSPVASTSGSITPTQESAIAIKVPRKEYKIPTPEELNGMIAKLCQKDPKFLNFLAEFQLENAEGINTDYLGKELKGTRPSFNTEGVKVPRYANDPLRFMNDSTFLGKDWYDYVKIQGPTLQAHLLALRDYIENPVEFTDKYINFKK